MRARVCSSALVRSACTRGRERLKTGRVQSHPPLPQLDQRVHASAALIAAFVTAGKPQARPEGNTLLNHVEFFDQTVCHGPQWLNLQVLLSSD